MIEETTMQVNAPLWISIGITFVLTMILITLLNLGKQKKIKEPEEKNKEWIFD